MTTDLERRLRHYGNTLDDASEPLANSTTPASFEADDVTVIRLRRDRTDGRRRPATLVGLAAASALLIGWAIVHRDATPEVNPAADTPVASVASSLPAANPSTHPAAGTWMVRLAPGVVAWYEASDPVTAALSNPRPGPAQDRVRCTEWDATADTAGRTVACRAVAGEGYLPTMSYGDPSPDGAYVEISTLPGVDIDATAYATNWSQGKDVGYDSPPLPQQDVTVNGIPGRLIAAPNGSHRVTWAITPGTLVAVETGPMLTVDQLMTVAEGVVPATPPPSIPLVLATASDTTGRVVEAVGDVVNGNVCVTTFDQGCASLAAGTDGPAFTLQYVDGYIVGLTGPDVAAVRVTESNGTTTDAPTVAQPTTGTVRAFAVITSNAVILDGLDGNGTPIAGARDVVGNVTGLTGSTTTLG